MKSFSILLVTVSLFAVSCERHEFEGPQGTKQLNENHAAAAHDSAAADDGVKYATGHFFSLHLRTHALAHLTVADQLTRQREHDMHALKRLSLEELRQGAPKGRQVLYVYDRAGIDFQQWHRWKHSGGLYFVSREPSGAR